MANGLISRTAKMVAYDFHRGTDTHAYEHQGLHCISQDASGQWSYTVRLFAPHAVAVSLCGDATMEREIAMRRADEEGVFETTLSSAIPLEGMRYFFRLTTPVGIVERADPYARCSIWDERTVSIACAEMPFPWRDASWLRYRARRYTERAYPFHAYQIHLGSFATRQGRSNIGGDAYLNYRELGEMLVRYVSDMGYTHVLLMPLTEYFADASHGYLPRFLFAPTSRFGSPDDLRAMVDMLHCAGIGVLMDLPIGCLDDGAGGLACFDGTALYEQPHGDDPCTFDLTRTEVRNYLLSAALYWLRTFHLDGLRPVGFPPQGGEECDAFLHTLCAAVHAEFPGVLLLSEQNPAPSPGFDLICRSHIPRALLRTLHADPDHRLYLQDQLLLSLMEPLGECAVLPLSHDVACAGRESLFSRMYGTYLQKFDTLRLCLAYWIAHPGKKLLFMSCDLAQPRPWDDTIPPDWFLTTLPPHAELHAYVRSLNRFYRDEPRLWQTADISPISVCTDTPSPIIAFRRYDAAGRELLTVFSFSAVSVACCLTVGTANPSYRPVFPQKAPPISVTPDGLLQLTLSPHAALYLDPVAPHEKIELHRKKSPVSP